VAVVPSCVAAAISSTPNLIDAKSLTVPAAWCRSARKRWIAHDRVGAFGRSLGSQGRGNERQNEIRRDGLGGSVIRDISQVC
jgi:hypothetical protein